MTRTAASKVTVRRLAAVDMWGTGGVTRRRRIILAEFLVALIALVALGLILLVSSPGMRVFGLWALGVGLNYLPLAAHALSLIRPGALEAELDGVDTARELRRYGVLQFVIFVPLTLVVMELHDMVRRRQTD